MSDWKERLKKSLEPILMEPDPRPKISAYHDMPYAIFRYPPEAEFDLRHEVTMLKTRLEQSGKRVKTISLAECMQEAMQAEEMTPDSIAELETSVGLEKVIETIHEVLSSYQPLVQLVAKGVPESADPLRDILFMTRTGALFPVYRASSLLEQLKGKIEIPSVLFYPGDLEGAAGLRFMGILDAAHNYRPKIF